MSEHKEKNVSASFSRLLAIMKEKGMSQVDLAKKLNLDSSQVVNNWKRRGVPRGVAVDIGQQLGIRPKWIIDGDGPKYDSLSMTADVIPPSTDAYIEGQFINVTTTVMRNVPLISWVQAGDFCEAIDNFHTNDAEEWIPTEYAVRAHTYALRVIGDSMTPDFPEGTILIVEPTEDVRHGRLVIAKRGNDVTFKMAVMDGTKWYLKPLNNAYPTVELTEETTICGIVVETLARRKTI